MRINMTDHTSCHVHNYTHCVRLVPIFNHLPEAVMDKIGRSARKIVLEKGEHLFRAGERDDTLYIIHRGKVRIYHLTDSGKEQLVRILHSGDFTGELAIFQPGQVHENYAEALQRTEVCLIRQKDLQQYLTEYPEVAIQILAEMSRRLKESEKQIAQVATESVETRIISFLANLVDEDAGDGPVVVLPMTKKDLASYLGTTPETISRKLSHLEQLGLIERLPKRKIKIPDLDRLLSYAD